jgi:succinate-acetate transporter protein
MSGGSHGYYRYCATGCATSRRASRPGQWLGEFSTARPGGVRGYHVHAQHDQRGAHARRHLAQLIAGVIQFRTGNTFTGVLFSTFGAFWLSLFAIAEFFLKDITAPTLHAAAVAQGQALGLFLYAFGIFTVWILIASFRTNVVVVLALLGLAATLFVLGAGKYYGQALTVETGGYMGLVVAGLAGYIGLAELCEASYKRAVLPLFLLAKH